MTTADQRSRASTLDAHDGGDAREGRPTLAQVDDEAVLPDDGGRPTRRGGRRRRPTGEPPPLPVDVWWRGVRWALLAVVVVTASLISFVYVEPDFIFGPDAAISRWFESRRSPGLLAVARGFDWLTEPQVTTTLRWATIMALLVVRRLRHLMVFVVALLAVEWAAQSMNFAIQRPRPMVDILGDWNGFSHPSLPIAALTVTALGSLRVLAPHGPIRRIGAVLIGLLVAVVGASRLILGVDHLTDVLVGGGMAAGVVFALTRLIVPHTRHPVEYRRGQTAHVTLSDDRQQAIQTAIRDQLGMEVDAIELHGAVGSAGSTPMRITLTGADGPDELFAKLYTRQHLRSDRLYKLVRLLMYGRLENETPFASVRQLVQYEDHLTRAMRDGGVRVPPSLGLVEITPEQEYLLAFEFTPGHDFDVEEDISTALIDSCLHLVDQLWTAGIAHRDIKPGNIMVDGDQATLIDVAFAQLRPTPWRQAVDLGAMLLMLSLAAGPDRVHQRALRVFEADEIAEALAATDGFAIPSQLRELLDAEGGAVQDRLRALSPDRDPIRIHRWDRRRLTAAWLTALSLAGAAAILWVAFDTVGLL